MCKDDEDKTRVDLIDPRFLLELGNILKMGAKKYAPESWKNVSDAQNRYYAAALRHLFAYKSGERFDLESNISHLMHAACCIMFIRYFERENEDKEKKNALRFTDRGTPVRYPESCCVDHSCRKADDASGCQRN